MGEMLFFRNSQPTAQGLNKAALPAANKIRNYIFNDYYLALSTLSSLPTMSNIILLYPGCGADILSPLLFVEKMHPTTVIFHLYDLDDTSGILQTVLADVGISFLIHDNIVESVLSTDVFTSGLQQYETLIGKHRVRENRRERSEHAAGLLTSGGRFSIDFYWHDFLVKLFFHNENVFRAALPEFNLYFERNFGLLKEQVPGWEKYIFEKLSPHGFIISDDGFYQFPLQKYPAPTVLSSYGAMLIGQKNG